MPWLIKEFHMQDGASTPSTSKKPVPTQCRSRYQLQPRSLEIPSEELPTGETEEAAVTTSGGPLRRLLWLLGYHSDEAITVRAASSLYEAVILQTDDDKLHNAVGMPPVFYSRWCGLRLPCRAGHEIPGAWLAYLLSSLCCSAEDCWVSEVHAFAGSYVHAFAHKRLTGLYQAGG